MQGERDPVPSLRPARVRLEEYNADWPRAYVREHKLLDAVVGEYLVGIEHIGSTAVPALTAKPVIDILAAMASYTHFPVLVARLEAIGYVYTPEAELDDPGRRVLRKGSADNPALRTHHMHVTLAGSRYWQRLIAFRDHLRTHPADAAAYVDLKRRLLARYADEPREYTRGKHEFVSAIEAKAGISPA